MSYQPPSQPGGESAPPPGDYTPPQPSGGYTPPSSGYSSPPPPPSSGGGYSEPPGGGYGSTPGGITPAGGGPSSLGHLPQSYLNAVIKPNANTYESEMPNASWLKVLISLAIVALVGFLLSFVTAGAATAQFDQAIEQMRSQGQNNAGMEQMMNSFRGFIGAGPFLALIAPFITFFLGAGTQYMAAKTLGGAQGGDFLTHVYLSSLSYTPLHIAATVVGIIPFVGGCISVVIYLYQVYCVGASMQTSQRMQAGRAQMSAFIPFILLLVLTLCLCVLTIVLAGAAAGS